MKFLSTFNITKGFDAWLTMYKDIEPGVDLESQEVIETISKDYLG